MSKTPMRKITKGEVLAVQGDAAPRLYKILAGQVALFDRYGQPDQSLSEVLTAPQCFGEVTLLTGRPRGRTAVAVTDGAVMEVPADAFETFLLSDHRNTMTILKTMAQRIAALEGLAEPPAAPAQPEPEPQPAAAVPAPPPPPEPAPSPEVAPAAEEDLEFYLPGHRGYPGVTHPEYRAHLFDKDYTCPHCKGKFSGARIFYSDPKLVAVQNPEASRYDLRIFYQDFELEWYEIITCPHCHFSALDSFFLEPKFLNKRRYEAQLDQAKKLVSMDFTGERDLEFVFNQHYLALVCSVGFTDFRQIQAHLWANLRWLYKSAGEEDLASQAEAKALETYKEVYSRSSLTPAQEQHLCITVAGMLYRQGDLKGAREWAVRVRMNRVGKKAYSQMAEQLIGEVRDQMGE